MNSSPPPPNQKVSFTNGDDDSEFIRGNISTSYPLSHRDDGESLEEGMEKFRISNPTSSSRYNHETNDDDDDDDDGDGGSAILFSSPPVTTPTRPGMMTTPKKSPAYNSKYRDENDESEYLRGSANNKHTVHEQQLKEALRWERQRREAAEREVTNLSLMLQSKDNDPDDENRKFATHMAADLNYIEDRLDRATSLLTKKSRDINGPSEEDEKNNELDNQMYEYHELATAFYNEQKHHSELDGEEFIPREDVVWLLHELKWRYEEILKKIELKRGHKINTSSYDCVDWKECVNELVIIIKKMVKEFTPITNGGNIDYSHSKDDTKQSGQPSYDAYKHTGANQSKQHQSMETLKKKYQEQIANMSQLVSDLESKLIEQEDGKRKLQEAIDEERHNFALNNEGSFARIRYLEGMVRSLEMELKNSRNRKNRTHETALPMTPPFRPVFMRDLTSDVMEDAENSIQDVPNVDSDEITTLRNQIISLGNSLAESEIVRATLLDEFQKERLNYMLQFKQMSDLLKRFMEGTECNYTT
jgi:hypothetical protein